MAGYLCGYDYEQEYHRRTWRPFEGGRYNQLFIIKHRFYL